MHSFWTAKFAGTFKRGYGRLDEETKRRVATAIERLLASSNPRKEGHMLHGPWKGCYSCEVGLKYRLIYRVDFERKEIEFLAVGSHKIY
ncbi:MAG: type II toxin-antitoxin system mRNA interferase toxin, RelE/StbE family [archaeon]|nr:type II toxin-antitoxin system mRNA interferase toxin, RelE/StbE family [archaeon]MCP8322342.1 type II toxin-antitoxin system mRNA interferase toxin, RelE/StbE family [archaeon]